MTRDELERCARFLSQGLDLDRQTQKRLVMHALGTLVPPDHRQGCAFHRGDLCDCADTGPMDLALKAMLTGGARCVWVCADCGAEQEGRENAFDCVRCQSRAGTIDRGAKPGKETR